MGLFKFEIPTPERAREVLRSSFKIAENYADRIAAQRALLPVTTPDERRAVRQYLEQKALEGRR